MTTAKAISKLTWRFSSGKPFTPNQDDIDSLNTIISHVNDSKSEASNSNQGFAKLYIWAYMEMIKRYKTDVFSDIPQKQLHRVLTQPIENFISRFNDQLNDDSFEELLTECGFDLSMHPVLKTEEIMNSDKKAAKKLLQLLEDKPEEKTRFDKKTYDLDSTRDNLMSMISEALIKYKL